MRSVNKFLKVEGHHALVRDVASNAIISTNDSEFKAYQKRREIEKNNKKLIDDQLHDIEALKSDINEIKSMLSQLIKGH